MVFIEPAPYRHINERIERQKDTNNHVSFLAGGTLCVLRLMCNTIFVDLYCVHFRPVLHMITVMYNTFIRSVPIVQTPAII